MEVGGVMMLVQLRRVFKMCPVGDVFYLCGDWCMGCWCVLLCVLMTCCKILLGNSSIDSGVCCSGGCD